MNQTSQPTNLDQSAYSDIGQLNELISNLTAQLKEENESIAKMMERQRQLKYKLLRAREQSLAAIRRGRKAESRQTANKGCGHLS